MTCRVNRIRTLSPHVERASEDDSRQITRISPVRPPRAKILKLELSRVDQHNLLPTPDVTKCPATRKRIPTIEWMSREMKDEVDKAVQNSQECRRLSFQTSSRRIRIHVRQHM